MVSYALLRGAGLSPADLSDDVVDSRSVIFVHVAHVNFHLIPQSAKGVPFVTVRLPVAAQIGTVRDGESREQLNQMTLISLLRRMEVAESTLPLAACLFQRATAD